MKARKVEIYIDGIIAHTFERSKGNEIYEVAIAIDNEMRKVITHDG